MKTITELDTSKSDCSRCDGTGWVCENHPYVPWSGMTGDPVCRGEEHCGGAGMPCPECNDLAVTEQAFDILEAWGERFPSLKAYYSRGTGGVDTFRLIVAVDRVFASVFDSAVDYILELRKSDPIRHPNTGER